MEAKAAVLSCSGRYKMSKRIPRCGHRRHGVRKQSINFYIQQPSCSQQIHNNSNVPIVEVGLHSVNTHQMSPLCKTALGAKRRVN